MITRRRLLEAAAVVPAIRALPAAGSQKQLKAIGVQLYTIRDVIAKGDAAAALKSLDQIGYREAEVVWASLDQVWPGLRKTRMRPVGIHMDSALFQPQNKAKLSAAIDTVKQHGFQYVVYPALPDSERTGGADRFKALADTLNEAGAQCHRLGMEMCYHNHAFDFRPIGSTTGLEILMTQADKQLVGFELDIFWASVAGHEPAELLKSHPGRFPLMHLKNKPPGMAVQFNETVPDNAFLEVGRGSLDIAAILRAAEDSGVKHFFVEQDRTPGNPVDSLKQSYEYLSKLKF